MIRRQVAVIVGGGPAGLTAAVELLKHTTIKPIILEASHEFGGISRTVNYRGNRMDIGGHRFFSKSDWVMNWWQKLLPVNAEGVADTSVEITYQNKKREIEAWANSAPGAENCMLVRPRLSRIYYLRKFFDYPIKLNVRTITNLGIVRMLRIGASYTWSSLFPRKPEKSLEDFLINRFGKELYLTFFKDYTEKVWGVPCSEISAEWGAQRIKGLSIRKALAHAIKTVISKDRSTSQKSTETSLIERFLYPKYGPGQMWTVAAEHVRAKGGEVRTGAHVVGVRHNGYQIAAAIVSETGSGQTYELPCDYFFSSMPVKDLIGGFQPPAPDRIAALAAALPYRDFITVGLLVSKMRQNRQSMARSANGMPPDNWIYIQEPDVKIGRLQIFNNWSPALVKDPDTVWLGLEYFCKEGDELWALSDQNMLQLAKSELEKIGLIDRNDVLDATVIRVPKAYPAYFGAYERFSEIREYVDRFENLFLIGRNGMHKYNNQDHSMLTAKMAVENIIVGRTDKSNIWEVNTEGDYHEDAEPQDRAQSPANEPDIPVREAA